MNNVTKFTLVAIALTAIVVSVPSLKNLTAGSSVSNWWPVEGSSITGVQPFKAVVDGVPVEDYEMFWSVDGGKWNWMDSNYTDYPHKEASVDVSNWKWNSDGRYEVKFIARSKGSTQVIGENEVSISVPLAVASRSETQSISPSTSPLPVVKTTAILVQAPVTQVKAVSQPVQTVQTSLAPKTNIWWPTDNATITGVQPFKVQLESVSLSNHSMFWQVDGGQLNSMYDSYTDAPHKEAMVDVTNWKWNGSGPYNVTFIAKDRNNSEIARKSVLIRNGSGTTQAIQSPAPQPVTAPIVQPVQPVTNPLPEVQAPAPAPAPVSAPTPVQSVNSGNPLSGMSFYVNPNSNALRQAREWQNSRPTDAAQMAKIYSQPEARWMGDWNANIYNDTKSYVDAAAARGEVPVMITYNVPGRDCGNYSAGGAGSNEAYKSWIRGFADGIGSRKAVVILEPDALTLTDCLSPANREARFDLIRDAIAVLKSKGNAVVYVDAGHSGWVPVDEISSRLKAIGVSNADGFALNTSNFQRTTDLITYGENISRQLGGEHFVIDTARNGNGPANSWEWCNPPGRALGAKVTANTGNSLVDAFLWLKNPGESDGSCNGAPSAGVWWPEYALGLAQRANY